MIKIDWTALINISTVKNPGHVKNAGNAGNTDNKAQKINDLEAGECVPHGVFPRGTRGTQADSTVQAVPHVPREISSRGTGQGDGNTIEKQIVSVAVPHVPCVPYAFNDTLEKFTTIPSRRRPWEIDPAGERQEEDAKFFRDLHRRACECAGLPAPVSPLADAMTVLLENWRHEDEAAWRRWAAKAPWDSEYLAI